MAIKLFVGYTVDMVYKANTNVQEKVNEFLTTLEYHPKITMVCSEKHIVIMVECPDEVHPKEIRAQHP